MVAPAALALIGGESDPIETGERFAGAEAPGQSKRRLTVGDRV
jgi:hypothetical protein